MGLEIQTGTPPAADGQYLCYVENDFAPKFARPEILMRYKNEWFHRMSDQRYRAPVYGWVPIPIRTVDSFFAPREYDL